MEREAEDDGGDLESCDPETYCSDLSWSSCLDDVPSWPAAQRCEKEASQEELDLSNVCSVPVPVSPSISYLESVTGDFVTLAGTADEAAKADTLRLTHAPVGGAEKISIAVA